MNYLDNAATTRVCPEAARAALEVMTEGFGNPSSGHAAGRAAAARLAEDRAVVAQRLGCAAEELYFTSCGTEGDNWSIRAAMEFNKRRGRHIVVSAIEHSAVLEPVRSKLRRSKGDLQKSLHGIGVEQSGAAGAADGLGGLIALVVIDQNDRRTLQIQQVTL